MNPGIAAAPQGPPAVAPQLRMEGITKSFGGVHALTAANLTIGTPGRVHCLIGENGSGKSTLLGILSGQLKPDAGRVWLDGEQVNFHSPNDALAKGVAVVSQETALVATLSIAENVLLGPRLVSSRGRIDWSASRRAAAQIIAGLGLERHPDVLVGQLRPDEQQLVEIARALSLDPRVLILDEPTSALSDDEVEKLFAAIRSLTSRGVSVLFVSHRLPELFAIGDDVTVLRDGRTVAEGSTADFDTDRIVEAMVGEDWQDYGHSMVADRPSSPRQGGEVSLALRDVECGGVRGVSLEVGRGEIVGLCGLVGAGRSELLEAIFGLRPIDAGEMRLGGEPFDPRDPRAAIARGIGYVPPDRKVRGLVQMMSVEANLTMPALRQKPWWRRPLRSETVEVADALCADLRVRTPSVSTPVSSLSGGSQQKVALGKWLRDDVELLVLDEPTRGVDVAAKRDIHQLLREAADRGTAVLISSSENPELIELCDRVVVMLRGEIVAVVERAEATETVLTRYAKGG